ncbi:response regulator transcription factor [Luteolibacter sp. SL250]|uniref:response regulator transcription factor n=1 Tax=Luteolibacter sp. SL250 TaxID=2995170 RepID=UPI00226FDF5C|nr:response regulator transcription factor [Luteolibacter sp. SL250]WAC20426.1 response regulator transcription factor [Luteolibacter sp. SL250]
MRLLVIEDELPMRTALVETLAAEGYRVKAAGDGISGLETACMETFDLVLLDVMMPGLDGYAVCRELRKRGRGMPVLMLTAKGQIDDRVDGLDSGADDYLVKPFSLRELLARVRALLRRRERDQAVPEVLELGTTVIDFRKSSISQGDRVHPLSEKEAGMLRLLAAYAGETVSREKFLDVVWGYNAFPSTRTVDNFISALRAKLEQDPANPVHLVTVRGTGYRLEQDSPAGERSHQE